MAVSQVVLYFDKQEDALMFTLAASSVMSDDSASQPKDALVKMATEMSKASRITTKGMLDSNVSKSGQLQEQCA